MKQGRKKPLVIDVVDQLEQSQNSKIDKEYMHFNKSAIRVTSNGIERLSNNKKNEQPYQFYNLKLSDIQNSGKRIGEGAASAVEEGIIVPLNVKVAIKKITVYDQNKRRQIENDLIILQENKEAQQNGCDFFVFMYDAFFNQGQVQIILELMDFGSIKDVIKKIQILQKQHITIMTEPILARICQQILCGLMHLHIIYKQVHRDIKPANILVNRQGQVKLTDFGVTKELEQTDQKLLSQRGTTAYMSPERIDGAEYGQPSDIWSFGMIVYELCIGQYPFGKEKQIIELHYLFESHQEKDKCFRLPEKSNFSNELKDFVSKCLYIDPLKRSKAVELLAHPFILNNLMYEANLAQWLQDLDDQSKQFTEEKTVIVPQQILEGVN
ncbi:hypothetical protein ABPG74_022373 [Tetrahymena malaccensis]